MRTITPTQNANLLHARNVMWPAVKPENVSKGLNQWCCGTHACFGGHVATTPFFILQGVVPISFGVPAMVSPDDAADEYIDGSEVATLLFGFEALFYARGQCEADAGFYGSDHALVSHRLDWAINNSVVDWAAAP